MKNFILKTTLFILFAFTSLIAKSQTYQIQAINFSNCTVSITALDGSMNPITGFINVSIAGLGGTINTGCISLGAVSYFQVDYGTCNSIIITVGGGVVGPFTPTFCCPCGSIAMSAFSVIPSGCTATYNIDIH